MHYYILITGASTGPYTASQMRTMWSLGRIPANAHYWTDGQPDWHPVHQLAAMLDPSAAMKGDGANSPYSTPNTTMPAAAQPLHANLRSESLDLLHLQSQMKSTGVAALLAIFIPYFGCLYSAPLAAVSCGALGILCLLISTVTGQPWFWWLLAGLVHIVSVFCAIRGVGQFNQKLIGRHR